MKVFRQVHNTFVARVHYCSVVFYCVVVLSNLLLVRWLASADCRCCNFIRLWMPLLEKQSFVGGGWNVGIVEECLPIEECSLIDDLPEMHWRQLRISGSDEKVVVVVITEYGQSVWHRAV